PCGEDAFPLRRKSAGREGVDVECDPSEAGQGVDCGTGVADSNALVGVAQVLLQDAGVLIELASGLETDPRKEVPSALRRGRLAPEEACTRGQAGSKRCLNGLLPSSQASGPKGRGEHVIESPLDSVLRYRGVVEQTEEGVVEASELRAPRSS